MKSVSIGVVVLGLLVSGCSKKQASYPPPDMNANGELHLGSMEGLARDFHYKFKRYPKDSEEMVKEKYIAKVPTAPAGKKIVINQENGQVRLVDE